ncbi:MAG: hypothetical protein AB7K08_00225 [Microbacteriaceae bacterium]
MIIWSRWGILVMLFVGLGVGLGFIIKTVAGVQADSGPTVGLYIGLGFILSAAVLFVVVRATVGKVIDKPRPAVVWQQLAQPVTLDNGTTVTQRPIPVTDPDTGAQLYTTPRSTLFFIPVKYWPYVLAGLGVVLIVVNLIQSAAG